MMAERENIQLNVLRNALYHTSRRRYFERLDKFLSWSTACLGTAAAATAMKDMPGLTVTTAVATGFAGVLQLVFGFGECARNHRDFQRDYYALLAEIEAKPEPNGQTCADWRARMILLTANEPATLRAIDSLAYNDAIDGIGILDREHRLVVPLYHRVLGPFLTFNGYGYDTLKERREKASGAHQTS